MLNPFAPFDIKFIDAFRKARKRYLVSQPFKRENHLFADDSKTYIMFSHYEDHGLAIIHYNAVKHEKLAAIVDLEIEKHRKTLLSMLAPDSKYRVYSSLMKDNTIVERALDNVLAKNLENYLKAKTNWHISKLETIKPKTELRFGELFVVLKRFNESITIPLADIENV